MLSASILVCAETRPAPAQDAPPDLRMLMNLDLFAAPPGSPQDASAAGTTATPNDSLLDQIRTLHAMGYLGNHPDTGENYSPREVGAAPVPSSNSTVDVEGPQQ